jgi:hypothetical protein
MYTQTSNVTPAGSVIRNYFAGGGWPFQLRHPEVWAAVRILAVSWFIAFGSILVSRGYAWGALLYLAAAKDLVLGVRLRKTAQALRH